MPFRSEVTSDTESDAEVLDHEDGFEAEYDEFFEEIDFEALGVDPATPTEAKPGSEDKVLMLAARYAAGLPLWHNEDCYDHGPGGESRLLLQ